jgi:predicted PurR-regulated permease PerM
MKHSDKTSFLLVGFGVGLYAVLMHLSEVLHFLEGIFSILSPLIVGGVIAFILNVPMHQIEAALSKRAEKRKKPIPHSLLRASSLTLTLAAIIVVLALVVTMVIPNLVQSVQSIYGIWQTKSPEWIAELHNLGIRTEELDYLPSLEDLQSLLARVTEGVPTMVQSVAGAAVSTVSAVASGVLAFVVALYILLYKEELCRQSKKLLYAYTKKPFAERVCCVAQLINQKYNDFLSGQCIEAAILGVLMYVSFTLFRLPYASLVAVLTAVTSFIPYVGACLSCIVGAILILMVSPMQCLISVIVYQVTQFIENQFIYPRVVGGSVGLSPFWTLIAVILGGHLFGVLGMIFFIPLTSVIYELVRDSTNQRLQMKKEP